MHCATVRTAGHGKDVGNCLSRFSARCNILYHTVYISRLCYDVSVRLSVTEVHWRIIANLGFKFRSKFTAHCGRVTICCCFKRLQEDGEYAFFAHYKPKQSNDVTLIRDLLTSRSLRAERLGMSTKFGVDS